MGLANGLIINVVSVKRKNGVLMKCCKGRKVKGSLEDGEKYVSTDSKTQITGCKFKVYVHSVGGKWRIRVYPGEFGMHNHSLFDEDHPTRGLSDGVKQVIQDMSKDGCRPCQIMVAIERKFPDEKVNRRQVYNYRKKLGSQGFPVLGDSSAMDIATKTLSVAKHHRYIIMKDCNQETGRVKSAHKQLKTWLETSTVLLDTLWAKVHLKIQTQLTEIRYKLEYSKQKIGTHYCGFPLNRLKCQVSHTCLKKLNAEWSKAQEWKEETNDRCDHVVYWTCRIPCAFALKKAADAGTSITLKHIHPFWATLNIGEQAATGGSSDVDVDVLYTKQLMEELNECPKAVRRMVNRALYDIMHLDQCSFKQPEEVKRRKGQPKGAKSKIKATPNVWDYRDETQGKSTTVTSDSTKKCPSSSGGHTDASIDIFASDISQYGCYDLIPWPIWTYITNYLDVAANGNCGFHVVVSNMYLCKEKWAMAREAIATELEQNWHLYRRIYVYTHFLFSML
ncbi:OLC1v1000765C1 [Oldenlandia corymbosa var. corymbosa]|uniref:OLC1v1000765C1 n=1 Tax=Oldenlandia corymbosa var. corymbosa TaxID=529605 RepID=A0AAV1D413_OLDCO|nr:OLC1v1000765C1 [Oldenlandia corymbosa var. corymbosa]